MTVILPIIQQNTNNDNKNDDKENDDDDDDGGKVYIPLYSHTPSTTGGLQAW